MIYKSEKEFKKRIGEILRSADILSRPEYRISGGGWNHDLPYDPKLNLYADFYISGTQQVIIECKMKPSAANIARGLGQCLLYRHSTRVKHYILCMPEFYRFDWAFNYWNCEELCKKYSIGFATEENVIAVLTELAGSLDVFHKLSEYEASLKEI